MKIFISLLFAAFSFYPSVGLTNVEGEIWEKLKAGGLVVLARHASVIKKENGLHRDPSCLKERKLSEKGKKQATRIGAIFTAKGVPINKVLASPYCRTTDTANIAFGKSQPAAFLSLLEALPQKQAEANTEKLIQKIGSYSGAGNLILVTHSPNINAVSFESVEMGAFLVLKPSGSDEFEEIGIINLSK